MQGDDGDDTRHELSPAAQSGDPHSLPLEAQATLFMGGAQGNNWQASNPLYHAFLAQSNFSVRTTTSTTSCGNPGNLSLSGRLVSIRHGHFFTGQRQPKRLQFRCPTTPPSNVSLLYDKFKYKIQFRLQVTLPANPIRNHPNMCSPSWLLPWRLGEEHKFFLRGMSLLCVVRKTFVPPPTSTAKAS